MYAKFVKETMGWETIEDENSFLTYEIIQAGNIKSLKIMEAYVDVPARGKDKSKELLDKAYEIAKKEGCNIFSAQINPLASEFIKQRTTHICRLFGMNISYEDNNMIVLSRSI